MDTSRRSGNRRLAVERHTARDAIGSLVGRAPVSVAEKLTLRSVAAVLSAEDIGAALVLRDDGSLGIVSERDVARALAEDADPDVVWSADVMTEEVVTARHDELVIDVAMRLLDDRVRHVAVVEGERIIGIVSSRDVFRVLADDAIAGAG
jgi:CBS domain-containing protein